MTSKQGPRPGPRARASLGGHSAMAPIAAEGEAYAGLLDELFTQAQPSAPHLMLPGQVDDVRRVREASLAGMKEQLAVAMGCRCSSSGWSCSSCFCCC